MLQQLLETLFPPKLKTMHPDDLAITQEYLSRENRTKHWRDREDLREVIE